MVTKIKIDKKRFKYAKRRAKLTNKMIGDLVGYSEDGIDKITRKESSGFIESSVFKELCKVLNIHPDYLTGKYSVKIHGISEDIQILKKKAFFQKYPDISKSDYALLAVTAVNNTDPDGYDMKSYSAYLTEISNDVCIERFRKFLLSVNTYEFTANEFLQFPTNEELSKILDSMHPSELWDFWDFMTHSAYDYLVTNGYYADFYAHDPTEEEITQRFKLKVTDTEKSRLEEI